MVETPIAMLHAEAIAAASERLTVLVMGTNDLAKELHAEHVPGRQPLLTGLGLCLLAARATGKVILDGVYNDIKDAEGFEAECVQGRQMGFDGKTLIHPSQLEPANRVLAPTPRPLEEARELIATFEEAIAAGKGVVTHNGRMIENLHVAANARASSPSADAIDASGSASTPWRDSRGMRYRRMPIEIESPEELGYDTIANNLSESSVADRSLGDLGLDLDLDDLILCYGDHLGDPVLREPVAGTGGGGLDARSRARHARRGGCAVRGGDLAARPGRPRRGGAHQLRHQHRDAAGRRRRRRLRRPRASRTASGSTSTGWPRSSGPTRSWSASPSPHNPTGTMCTRGRARRGGRPGRARRGHAAVRRDLPRPHPRRAAAAGRLAVGPGGERELDVEGLRPARASGSAGRSPPTRSCARRCSPPRSRS